MIGGTVNLTWTKAHHFLSNYKIIRFRLGNQTIILQVWLYYNYGSMRHLLIWFSSVTSIIRAVRITEAESRNMSENYTTKATSKEYGIEMFYNLIYKAQLWAKLEVLSFTSLIEKALNRINQWFQFLVCSYRKHLIWKSMYKVGILQKSSLQIN